LKQQANTALYLLQLKLRLHRHVSASTGGQSRQLSNRVPSQNNTPAQAEAQSVIDLLNSGRASEVTDEMLAAADNTYLYNNYDLPMDEASRMARAEEMGFDTDAFHATRSDLQGFDPAKRGSQNDAGWFGDADYFSPNSDYVRRFTADGTESGQQVLPVRLNEGKSYDWREMEADRSGAGLYQNDRDLSIAKTQELQSKGYDSVSVNDPVLKFSDGEGLSDDQWQRLIKDHPMYESQGVEWVNDALRSKNGVLLSEMQRSVPSPVWDEVAKKSAKEIAIFDPTNIRSKFARFDPRLKHLKNLSAGMAAMGLLDLLTPEQREGLL
jgi:hypothetical protein